MFFKIKPFPSDSGLIFGKDTFKRNVVPGPTKVVDPGACFTLQNHGDQ